MRLGLIIVPIDPMSKELELEYALNDSGATLVVAFDSIYPVVKGVKDKCKLKDVIVTSFSDYLPDKPTITLHKMMTPPKQTFPDTYEFLELVKKYPPNPPKVDVGLDDYAWILYTGGTTGAPKGCVHTHYDFSLTALGQCQIGYECTSKDDVIVISWPHTHVSGITIGMAPTLLNGMTIIPLARWDALAAMEAIDKYKGTLIQWAVPQFWDIINHPENKNYDLTSLRLSFIVPFAMPITQDVVEKWQELTGCPVYDWGYGSSEHMNYCGYGTGLPFPRPPCATLSRLAPEVQVKILDFETGKELPEGEEGEIVTKEPAQLKEYWNKPEETKKDMADGWLHMHDRGYMKDGVLYFMGKAADVCKVRGYTVALKEVEMYGAMHPAVNKIAVIAIPDPKIGSLLKAFVTLRPGAKLTAPELEEWFKENIAVFKRPIVEIREELPLSGKGDIIKRKLLAEELKKRES